MFSKRQLKIAQARHDSGQRWYDGPELLVCASGIGTREELDQLKADGIIPADSTYRPATPADVA